MEKNESKHNIKIYFLPIVLLAVLISIDQLTKYIIVSNFSLYESIPLIENVFSITYIQNKGAGWGLLQGQQVLFLCITAFVLIFTAYIFTRVYKNKCHRLLSISLVVLAAGSIGNMIDRIKQGYVIDFFNFELIDFPVFNVADIYIVISMISIFLLVMFKYSNEDLDEIIGKKKNSDVD